jgi:hypothetical protein
MHQFSFDFGDPIFDLAGYRLGLQVITFENTYALDPTQTRLLKEGDGWRLESKGLCSAGGQQKHPGRARLDVSRTADGLEIVASAEHSEKIRCLKLLLRDLPTGEVVGPRWQSAPVPFGGRVLRYPFDPEALLPLHTPLVFLSDPDGGFHYFRSRDERVRCKRFAFCPDADRLAVELIHEEAGHEMQGSVTTPPWRVGRCGNPEAVVEEHLEHLERAFGLEPWETRWDVPVWAREIALVVSIHGMHWTGYVFNSYEDTLRTLQWVCERIEGRRVLAFLPGWEGRYYWQYGDYRPEPRLGGAEGFRKLAEGARRLGVALMPMFGANCANTGLEGFERWGEPSRLRSAGGLELQGNKPDWDVSRAGDPGWQAWLNPGAPAWRERLLTQVSDLVETYRLQAAFFDTHNFWENDPNHPVYEGLVALRDALKQRFPDLLVVGEGWYDALGAVTPVSQTGDTRQWPQIFSRYCRTFAHLMTGDPSRASTGVHEAGTTGFVLMPEGRHWWPTVTIVDGTLDLAPEKVEQVIQQAHGYARRYLE